MAPARTYLLGFSMIVTVFLLILSFTLSFPISGYDDDELVAASYKQNKKILGSRPPRCVNKCWNCKPCEATLVIPPHPKMTNYKSQSHWEDYYYLLSWKCKCGDKLFQP